MSILTPETLMQEQHKEWVKNPCTIKMLGLLEEYKQATVDYMSQHASDANMDDSFFRNLSYAIQTIDTVKRLMSDTPTFVAKSLKQ